MAGWGVGDGGGIGDEFGFIGLVGLLDGWAVGLWLLGEGVGELVVVQCGRLYGIRSASKSALISSVFGVCWSSWKQHC